MLLTPSGRYYRLLDVINVFLSWNYHPRSCNNIQKAIITGRAILRRTHNVPSCHHFLVIYNCFTLYLHLGLDFHVCEICKFYKIILDTNNTRMTLKYIIFIYILFSVSSLTRTVLYNLHLYFERLFLLETTSLRKRKFMLTKSIKINKKFIYKPNFLFIK